MQPIGRRLASDYSARMAWLRRSHASRLAATLRLKWTTSESMLSFTEELE